VAYNYSGPKVTFYGQNLKLLNPTLFLNVAKLSGDPLEGRATIPLNSLDPDIKEQLLEALPLLGKMPAPGSIQEKDAMNRARIDEATRIAEIAAKEKALKDSGDEQLRIYRAAGLADTERNSRWIREYLEENANGVYCAVTVRTAVENQRANLDWIKVPVVAAAAPAQEPVTLLSNGEAQLPLNATQSAMRRASVTQLRDLARRRGEGQSRPHAIASKF
jgi:hypothetical protein